MNASTIRLAAALSGFLTLATGSLAGPRETVSFQNVNINGPAAAVRTANLTGGYTARFVTVSGVIFRPTGGVSRANDAIIQAVSPDGRRFTIQPFVEPGTVITNGILAGTTTFIQKLPAPINVAPGRWTFRFIDTQDDAGAIDTTWLDFNMTLNDGPPATVADFGVLPLDRTVLRLVPLTGGVSFIRFTLDRDAAASAGRFLDIDTEATNPQGGAVNPKIALFNEEGRRMAFDDDDATGTNAQLTFGAGTRPAPGDGRVYDGRDGTLPAGTYFLAVAGAGASFPGQGWAVTTNSASIGPVHIRIRSNTAREATCPADMNGDGTVNQTDLNTFMSLFNAGGC